MIFRLVLNNKTESCPVLLTCFPPPPFTKHMELSTVCDFCYSRIHFIWAWLKPMLYLLNRIPPLISSPPLPPSSVHALPLNVLLTIITLIDLQRCISAVMILKWGWILWYFKDNRRSCMCVFHFSRCGLFEIHEGEWEVAESNGVYARLFKTNMLVYAKIGI